MLIIKEKIFIDANTGSSLGGRTEEGRGDRQKRLRTLPLPYTFAIEPLRSHLFFATAFVSEGFWVGFGLDNGSMGDRLARATLTAKLDRIIFIFFPKCLIFPASSSLTF
ncbi:MULTISPECIES: hypothetical protein [unclassified Microcoleus]|uniref:hypothetical protein n=1 Tax=unclassified Microcoleus TaxID=2642155 RepID=UPI0025E341C8|nr:MULTISPECIES: hypothetical protein [unclassified Microcoleus]